MKAFLSAAALGAACLAAPLSATAAEILGPTPYAAPADAPWSGQPFNVYVLETFDGAPLAGYVASAGVKLDFGSLIDSVGGTGASWYANGSKTISFSFAPYLATHGVLPNRAGIVWTDVGFQDGECCGTFSGVGLVEFEAFDENGASLGVKSAVLGDGFAAGGIGEDRFFGASNAGGVSRIEIRMPTSGDFEVDHLQFGTAGAVPEPAAWALMISGFGLAGASLRRRRSTAPVVA